MKLEYVLRAEEFPLSTGIALYAGEKPDMISITFEPSNSSDRNFHLVCTLAW